MRPTNSPVCHASGKCALAFLLACLCLSCRLCIDLVQGPQTFEPSLGEQRNCRGSQDLLPAPEYPQLGVQIPASGVVVGLGDIFPISSCWFPCGRCQTLDLYLISRGGFLKAGCVGDSTCSWSSDPLMSQAVLCCVVLRCAVHTGLLVSPSSTIQQNPRRKGYINGVPATSCEPEVGAGGPRGDRAEDNNQNEKLDVTGEGTRGVNGALVVQQVCQQQLR